MWWSYWPTASLFLPPLLILACITAMFMMCGMHARHHPSIRMPTRFPGGQSPFEDYRAATLQRLDQEQKEFHNFLGRLRTAKDKTEFDQFMAERRARTSSLPDGSRDD